MTRELSEQFVRPYQGLLDEMPAILSDRNAFIQKAEVERVQAAGITVCANVIGDADQAVREYLVGALSYNTQAHACGGQQHLSCNGR